MLFFAELWERFCFYGMRALLAVHVAQLFMVQQKDAALVYGAYTSLVYALGTAGGRIADRVLGFRRAILVGGVVMAAGEFLLVIRDRDTFLLGLSLLVVGTGLFKPNISSLVGKLYREGDPRRDAGFTIFYMGINIGALLAPLACAQVAYLFPIQVPLDELAPGFVISPQGRAAGYEVLPDYRWGFALAGAGMLLGLLIFGGGLRRLGDKGLPPPGREGPWPVVAVLAGCAVAVPAVYALMSNEEVAGYLLLGLAVIIVAYFVATAVRYFGRGDRITGQRLLALIGLLLANTVFWSCFEQAGNSLNFFARDHVHMPALGPGEDAFRFRFEWFQSVNSLFIVMLGPVFIGLWRTLEQRGRNPSIPVKFGLGIVQVALGFGVILLAMDAAGAGGKAAFLSLVLLYLLHTTGELCISPVGLSMVTKLAPPHLTGLTMGAWFLSMSCAYFIAGVLSWMAGGGGVDEGAADRGEVVPMSAYAATYELIFWYALGAGVLMLLLARPLDRLLHGIK